MLCAAHPIRETREMTMVSSQSLKRMPVETFESTVVNESLHTVARLVKRRRALLESTPPRNSRLETHPDDEAGASACGSAPPSDG